MSIKEKIKLYEENIIENKKIGYKKSQINTTVRRKINHWNNINNEDEKKIVIEEKKNKNIDDENECDFENCVINM